jgi:hypothetical protein
MQQFHKGTKPKAALGSSDTGAFARLRNTSLEPPQAQYPLRASRGAIENQAVPRQQPQQSTETPAPSSGVPSWDFSRIPVHSQERRTATVHALHEQQARPGESLAPKNRGSFPSPGYPLDHKVRHSMEARFGQDLSEVRVRTDPEGATLASHHGASALTSGREISFAAGRYAPHTREGAALLAHELTHVLQQRRVGAAPGTEHEAEAWAAARSVTRGTSPIVVLGSTPGAVQCAAPPGKDPVSAVIDDPSLPTEGFSPDLGEAAAIGSAGERHQFVEAEAVLKREGYTEIYFKENFPEWVQKVFPKTSEKKSPRSAPEVVAYAPKRNQWLVEDFAAGPWTQAKMKPGDPRRLPQEPPEGLYRGMGKRAKVIQPPEQQIAHLEKTIDDAQRLARNLPPQYKDAGVSARDRYYKHGVSREVNVKRAEPPATGPGPSPAPGRRGPGPRAVNEARQESDAPSRPLPKPSAVEAQPAPKPAAGALETPPRGTVTEPSPPIAQSSAGPAAGGSSVQVDAPEQALGASPKVPLAAPEDVEMEPGVAAGGRTGGGTGLSAFQVAVLAIQLFTPDPVEQAKQQAIQRELDQALRDPKWQTQLIKLQPMIHQSSEAVYYRIKYKVNYSAEKDPTSWKTTEYYNVKSVEILEIGISRDKTESSEKLNPPHKPMDAHSIVPGGTYMWKASQVITTSRLPVRPEIGATSGSQGDPYMEIQQAKADKETVARIPVEEKVRIMNRLFNGPVSDEDVETIKKFYANTPPNQRVDVRRVIEQRIPYVSDIAQRTQLRGMLAGPSIK